MFALDRSARTFDEDGRLRVALTPISKACVNPYRGSEIPGGAAMGLVPDRIYQLFRDPAELAKAAESFNGVQLLDEHIPVDAENPQQERVAGAIGTDVRFEHPYLKASLIVWNGDSIRRIENHEQKQLSAGYRYEADMTPGEYQGQHYDGVMRNMRGNHVALVKRGRAGPDVVIGDADLDAQKRDDLSPDQFAVPDKRKLPIENAEHVKLAWDLLDDTEGLTAEEKAHARTRILHAAEKFGVKTAGWKKPRMATDSHKEMRMTASRKAALDAVLAKLKPFLAQDADLDKVKDALDEDETEEERKEREAKEKAAQDEEEAAKKKAEEDDKDKQAKDAALALDAAIKQVRADLLAARDAERAVRPFIGDVTGLDSADAIYKLALDQMGVDTKGVHPSAYPALLKFAPKPGAEQPRVAMDSASVGDFNKRFPGAARITKG